MKKIPKGFSKWDVTEILKTEAARIAYFEAVLEEDGDDPAFVAKALGDIARARGMSKVARDTGISREGLYNALSVKGNPELATVLKVIKALGMRLHIGAA